jgi:hypothetical protein
MFSELSRFMDEEDKKLMAIPKSLTASPLLASVDGHQLHPKDSQNKLTPEYPQELEQLIESALMLHQVAETLTTKLRIIHPAPRADTMETTRMVQFKV